MPVQEEDTGSRRRGKVQIVDLGKYFSEDDYVMRWDPALPMNECSPYADMRQYFKHVAKFVDAHEFNNPRRHEASRTVIYHMRGATVRLHYYCFTESLAPFTMGGDVEFRIISEYPV